MTIVKICKKHGELTENDIYRKKTKSWIEYACKKCQKEYRQSERCKKLEHISRKKKRENRAKLAAKELTDLGIPLVSSFLVSAQRAQLNIVKKLRRK